MLFASSAFSAVALRLCCCCCCLLLLRLLLLPLLLLMLMLLLLMLLLLMLLLLMLPLLLHYCWSYSVFFLSFLPGDLLRYGYMRKNVRVCEDVLLLLFLLVLRRNSTRARTP